MKIFANKEIKKLFLAVSVIWVVSLLLTQGFFMVVLSAVFAVFIACFLIDWNVHVGSMLFLFQKTK